MKKISAALAVAAAIGMAALSIGTTTATAAPVNQPGSYSYNAPAGGSAATPFSYQS